MSPKQQGANDALDILHEMKGSLSVVKEFIDNTNDEELSKTAKDTIDQLDLLRLKLFNRSVQGKYRK